MKDKLALIKSIIDEINAKDLGALLRQKNPQAKELRQLMYGIAGFVQAVAIATPAEGHSLPEEMEANEDDIFERKRNIEQDFKNLHRSWGLSLLKADALDSGKHAFRFLKESRQELSSMDDAKTRAAAKDKFEAELKEQTSIDEVLAYAMSGSDAVNLVYNLAINAGRRRLKDTKNQLNPKLVFFHGMYGAGRGEAAMINWAKWGARSGTDQTFYTLPSPTTTIPPKLQETALTPQEQVRLKEVEDLALLRLMNIDNSANRIGAILIEPIQGSAGVRFYRPAFLVRLQKWADNHKIPIVADEVLTGGGRTGKFFAYQHYENFHPSYVTFGKGLQIAGLARLARSDLEDVGIDSPFDLSGYDIGIVTNQASAPMLLKGAKVLRTLREKDLISQVEQRGVKLLATIRRAQFIKAGMPEATGVGYFIGAVLPEGLSLVTVEEDAPDTFTGTLPKRQRLMPPLDITQEELEQLQEILKDADWAQVKDDIEDSAAGTMASGKDLKTSTLYEEWKEDAKKGELDLERLGRSILQSNYFHGVPFGTDRRSRETAMRKNQGSIDDSGFRFPRPKKL